jgi:hypothetical protein
MFKVGTLHHILAYSAATVAAASVILALISRLTGETLWLRDSSYLTVATVALLFAIYFLAEGWADAAEKS